MGFEVKPGCLKMEQQTGLAEREGFEPSIRFPVYTLSKRAPSATRPPLHPADASRAARPIDRDPHRPSRARFMAVRGSFCKPYLVVRPLPKTMFWYVYFTKSASYWR